MEESKSHLRYKEGINFAYDLTVASECRLSSVLNGNFPDELTSLLEGKQQILKELTEELEDDLASQTHSRQVSQNKGIKWKEDDKSRDRRLTKEALIDVCKWELHTLKNEIEQQEQDKKEKEIPACLKGGPRGMNGVRGDKGSGYVDGQWCETVEGVIVITDRRSPYRGLSVEQYTEKVVDPWVRAVEKHTAQKRRQLLKDGVPEERLLKKYSLPFPPFPPSAKNYLNGTTKGEPKKFVRTNKK